MCLGALDTADDLTSSTTCIHPDIAGEFFHDMYDFRDALDKILKNADVQKHYEPREWVTANYGNDNSVTLTLEL